jgi:hypothetical protein
MRTKHLSTIKQADRLLRYREIPNLIGAKVVVSGPITAALEVLNHIHHGIHGPVEALTGSVAPTVMKYGLMDLQYQVPRSALDDVGPAGTRTLKHPGFVGDDDSDFDDLGIELLRDLIEETMGEGGYFNLSLYDDKEHTLDDFRCDDIPAGLWSRTFTVDDACLTNCPSVWFVRHFYL